MKQSFLILWVSCSIVLFSCTAPQTVQNTATSVITNTENISDILKQMPAPEQGYKRMVISLPAEKDAKEEGNYKVEIIPGKQMKVDCNKHGLMGELTEKNLEGWGYVYYEFTGSGDVFSTKMGCPDNALHNEFVSGKTQIVAYNSNMPLVVYIPETLELRYKIWEAASEYTASEK